MNSLDLDLDVDVPEKVALKLEELSVYLVEMAQQYRESASELASAWQDRYAGRVWDRHARTLDGLAKVAHTAAVKAANTPI